MSLAEARDAAAEVRRRIYQGKDVLRQCLELREQAANETRTTHPSRKPKQPCSPSPLSQLRGSANAPNSTTEPTTHPARHAQHVFLSYTFNHTSDLRTSIASQPKSFLICCPKSGQRSFPSLARSRPISSRSFSGRWQRRSANRAKTLQTIVYSLMVLMEPLQRHAQHREHFAACSFEEMRDEIPGFFI